MNIDYNLYRIFLYLYEEKSISKTAVKLYVSQPAVSYSLKELENQLGYKLFYRNSKGIEPTVEAKELYKYISTAFNIFNDAEEHLKNLNSLNFGSIRIGVPTYIGVIYLSDYIEKFRIKYPGIKFEIISASTDSMIEMLENRKLDLVLDTLPIQSKKSVSKVTLTKLKNCFFYNKKLMKDVSIKSIEDLKNYQLIFPYKTLSIRKKLDEYLESKNLALTPVIESINTDMFLELVRRGLGIGYFAEDIVKKQKDFADFELISFTDLPDMDVCSVYIDEFLTIATSEFIKMLKSNNN